MQKKITLRYSDGRYYATEGDGPAVVEVDEYDWHEYLEHLESDQKWQDFFLKLDNAQHEKVCSICGRGYDGFGHNAQPVNPGRCCDKCNSDTVIPTRVVNLYRQQEGAK